MGKTVTTANLAAALALIYDKKVLAIDTNVSTASLGLHFNIYYPDKTIDEISEKSIYESISIYHQNLHVIPASIRIKKESRNLKKVRENLLKTIKNYEKFLDKISEEYDLVLLDCSPGFDLESIAAMEVAGGLIIVTNPDYPSVVTAIKAMEYAKRSGMPVGGIILNKLKNKKYELKSEEIEKALGAKIIGQIPYDKRVPESISNNKPVVLFKTNSKSGKAFRKVAASIIGENPEKSWFANFLDRLRSKD